MEKILLLLILLSTTNRDNSNKLVGINEYISNIEIDADYTKEKVQLARKIIPYMPVNYIKPINRSIHITESLVKIMELEDYMNRSTRSIQSTPIPIKDNKERLSKIVSIIQKEVPKAKVQNTGTFLELIINIDRYKKMFDLLNSFMENQNLSKDPESLAKIVEPMIKSDAQGEGSLDFEKIMNIMSLLNKSKGEKTNSKQESKVNIEGEKEPNEN